MSRTQMFEPLERRTLLSGGSLSVWTGAGDGTSWHDSLNWEDHRLPNTSDDVVLNTRRGYPTILVDQSESVRSVSSHLILKITGSLSLSNTSNFDAPVMLEGTLKLLPGSDGVIRMTELEIADAAAFDLADGTLIIDYADGSSPLNAIRTALASGYDGGRWNGAGLSSSSAALNPGHALGYAEASALFSQFPAAFAAEELDDTSILVRYTLQGDADLNRTVDSTDFNILASHFGSTGLWSNGDFDYDTIVNLNDFNTLASRFGQILAAPQAQASVFSGRAIEDDREDRIEELV